MSQHLSGTAGGLPRDPGHPGVRTELLRLPRLGLLCLVPLLHPTPGQAQTGASLQVAAKVLPAEPSRSALTLALSVLEAPAGGSRTSILARIRAEPTPARETPETRRVRIDFLRN